MSDLTDWHSTYVIIIAVCSKKKSADDIYAIGIIAVNTS